MSISTSIIRHSTSQRNSWAISPAQLDSILKGRERILDQLDELTAFDFEDSLLVDLADQILSDLCAPARSRFDDSGVYA